VVPRSAGSSRQAQARVSWFRHYNRLTVSALNERTMCRVVTTGCPLVFLIASLFRMVTSINVRGGRERTSSACSAHGKDYATAKFPTILPVVGVKLAGFGGGYDIRTLS
jgi:hypothetical protein